MFKLAELFVQIAADETPLQKVVKGLKGSLPGVANALGGVFSNAFTAALGPIGLVMKAYDGLVGLIGEGNEDIVNLQSYFEEAMAPIKAVVEGVAASFNTWVTGLIETAKASAFVTAAFATFQTYAESAFENVKIAIDQGIEVFDKFYAIATETFTGAVILAQQFGDYVMKAFGGPALESIQTWGQAIQTWVTDKIELAGIFIRNWSDFFEIAGLKIQETVINIGEYLGTIPANLAIIGNYIANNWVKLITDAINAVGTAFKNLGTNLGNLGSSIVAFFKDPTKGFKFEWKGMLEGFHATADKLPELIKPALTSMDDQIKVITGRIGDREAKGFAAHVTAKKKAEDEAATAGGGEAGKFKSQTEGVADFRSKLINDIFSGKDDTAKQQLEEQKKTTKAVEKLADKPTVATLG